jgi:hypothetical protein
MFFFTFSIQLFLGVFEMSSWPPKKLDICGCVPSELSFCLTAFLFFSTLFSDSAQSDSSDDESCSVDNDDAQSDSSDDESCSVDNDDAQTVCVPSVNIYCILSPDLERSVPEMDGRPVAKCD